LETTRRWRFGVNRWIVLGIVILMVIGVNLVSPVMPHIQVAPEPLSGTVTLPVIGPVFLSNTTTTNILVVLVVILLAYLVKRAIERGEMVPSGVIVPGMEMLVEVLYNMTETTTGAKWARRIFPWFATLLIYILVANLVRLTPIFETFGLLHHAEEGGHAVATVLGLPTVINQPGEWTVVPFFRGLATDLNFTVALALLSVIFTQVYGFQALGGKYLVKFFNFTTFFKKPFFGAIDFAVGLLELISQFALILSYSFRLFGNIFAGTVLTAVVVFLVPVFVPSVVMLLEFDIGMIQAFVFGMLTMVFMSQAVTGHGEEAHA